ncbi:MULTISPECIES: class I SAM-dependent methyltransferase [Thermoactinomyces]|jgi:ubiquinone/menaquinone biosynthesis C-methylase UbiE|uniref:Methyltransferase domain-containing protein n=1 Tax=Thermoactinomyces daqus TaxID=1329516 RepID=A0A7W2AGE1_9BACL|nr:MULTISPECIES: class I SAM-dependent methyltransferase [Thermoactinomyces]MBA4542112.1 methyltransferase domain-containing protein [Thermoactinomyces daqus]MBH8598955.1 methyltransferase domain-containing protein [Thermoactinomyces sp. CICC 10523]MBH8604941.1 methyltransferase domain-containing protein [Thermoactinomyces sp. CICC 10522]MBH8608343.1 methyltransferase domain-containing protein [Thermoactinomyces sp. CICC 10521]
MPSWYEESFGEDYLIVYKHRTREDAICEVGKISRWLHLRENDLILDLCCGTGRHTLSLAKRGYHVVGLDLSKVLLTHAVKDAGELAVPFIHGDMRYLPFVDEMFDVVLNLFTSFGYFSDDEDNQQVLREIARVLKPGGRYLLDFLNKSYVVQNLVPKSEREEDGVRIREERWIDGDFVCKAITITDESGTRRYQERVKMYDSGQLEQMLEKAGLNVEKRYGSFAGEPIQSSSKRIILIGCVNK